MNSFSKMLAIVGVLSVLAIAPLSYVASQFDGAQMTANPLLFICVAGGFVLVGAAGLFCGLTLLTETSERKALRVLTEEIPFGDFRSLIEGSTHKRLLEEAKRVIKLQAQGEERFANRVKYNSIVPSLELVKKAHMLDSVGTIEQLFTKAKTELTTTKK